MLIRFYQLMLLSYLVPVSALAVTPVSLETLRNPNAVAPLHAEPIDFRPVTTEAENPLLRPISFRIALMELDIEVLPEFGRILGSNTLTIEATEADVSFVTLDAVDMTIAGVEMMSGEALDYYYDGAVLGVALPTPLSFGEETTFRVRYETTPTRSFYVTGPDVTSPDRMIAAYTYTQPLGSRFWYPCLDRPSAKAPLTISVAVRSGLKVLSNGFLIEQRSGADGYDHFVYRMDEPVAPYLVSLAIGEYEIVSLGQYRGKPLTLWTPPAIRDKAHYDTDRTVAMMDIFTQFTGTDYPYGTYSQSVAQAWGSSMEHQAATTMGGMRIVGDRSGEGVVAHELAHQWFGDHVTCETWEDLWLNEGFASYLPMVFFDAIRFEEDAIGYYDWWRYGYFGEARQTVRALSPTAIDPSAIFDSHSYEKGALVINHMRHVANRLPIVGGAPAPETFTSVLRHYLTTHGGGNVRHQDLQASLEVVTGRSWQRFFDQWVRSPGHPRLNATVEIRTQDIVVELTQTQVAVDGWRAFQFPLTVQMIGADGSTTETIVDVYQEHQRLTIPAPNGAVAIQLDPFWELPAEISLQQSDAAWIAVIESWADQKSVIAATRALMARYRDTPLPAAALTAIETSGVYAIASAVEELSVSTIHRSAVETLVAKLEEIGCTCSYGQVAEAAGRAWLVETASGSPTADDIRNWQAEYLDASLHGVRAAYLRMLDHADRKQAQIFAADQLARPDITTRDRRALIQVLTGAPTDSSERFIHEALRGATTYHLGTILTNLTAAGYDAPDHVDVMIDQAKAHRFTRSRHGFIALLGVQASSAPQICAEVSALETSTTSLHATSREGLMEAIGRMADRLGCTR